MFLKPLHVRTIDVLLAYPESRKVLFEQDIWPIDWYLHRDELGLHPGGYPQHGMPSSAGVRPPQVNHYFERLAFSPQDNFGYIQGWANDTQSPLDRITIQIGDVEIVIPASRLIRTLRPELNKKFETRDPNPFAGQRRLGFMGLFRSPGNWSPAAQARIEIVCDNGLRETADVPVGTLETAESISRIEDLLEREETRVGLRDLVEPLTGGMTALAAIAACVKPVMNGRDAELASYADGNRIAVEHRPRRTTWVLLLDDHSPLHQASWIASFDKRPLRGDQILIVATKTLQDMVESVVLPLTYTRGMNIDVLYVEQDTATVLALEHARAAADGTFVVFIDQTCHLNAIPDNLLNIERDLRACVFTGLTTEPNGTIYEGGDDLAMLLDSGQVELVQSALSRAELKWMKKNQTFAEGPGALCCGFRAEIARDLGGFDQQFETRRFAYADLAARFRPLSGSTRVLRELRFDQVVATTLLKDFSRRQMRRDLVRLVYKHGGVTIDKPSNGQAMGLFQ